MTLHDSAMLEIGTFLARRWSGNDSISVSFSDKVGARTRLSEGRIIIPTIRKRLGDDFARYRQFRMDVWYESMRVRFCNKILSNDHAFGFILNTLETHRIERLGRKVWQGMDEEIIFAHTYRFLSRPSLPSVYGRARILEAFYQHFTFGAFRGEVQPSQFERILQASKMSKRAVEKALTNDYGTTWLEKSVGDIVKHLDIDALQTVPVSLPFVREDMPVSENDVTRFLRVVYKKREGDFGRIDAEALLRGDAISGEYHSIVEEEHKDQKRESSPAIGDIKVPTPREIDESVIYDMDLISGLKTRFRAWRRGYKETYHHTGEEFDTENYIDGYDPFYRDRRQSIKTKIIILLDHSSSISPDALGYKKATLGLCEVMSYLGVRFAVYAFNTQERAVVCWLIKPHSNQWGRTHAKRLAQVVANGSTPLAQVYQKMLPALESWRPDIFLTLTDGEPSDSASVRETLRTVRRQGVKAVAMGLGPGTFRATQIAANLKRLGYDRTLAISRLSDIPGKVLGILDGDA